MGCLPCESSRSPGPMTAGPLCGLSPNELPMNTANRPQQSYTLALTVLATVFFMWGFATVLNDILVPHLKAVFSLNYAQSLLLQLAFYLAYLLMALPAAKLLEKIGYKLSIVFGLVG